MAQMLVETFEVTETYSDGSVECEAEALELIEKLGLEGQQKLVAGDGESRVRSPYRKMTKEEAVIYQALCPQESALAEFSESAIPVRVLQVAAHAVDLFDHLIVWSAENADVKDPILVGFNGSKYSTTERFILARWGAELLPLSELAKLAGEKIRATRIKKLHEIMSIVTGAIASTKDAEPESLIGVNASPYIYGVD